MDASLDRLTENEKECLRRRLRHQTAKEMALDLRISPHAVEKRLKMARLKLGVGSSLAAARLLADADGYGMTPPRTPDLPATTPAGYDGAAAPPMPRRRVLPAAPLAGVLLMLSIALLALLSQSASRPAPAGSSPVIADGSHGIVLLPDGTPGPHLASEPATERSEDITMRAAGPDEVAAFVRSSFATMDKDRSGFIEQVEAPSAGVGIPEPRPGHRTQWFTGRQGQAMWVALVDTDRDGRASEAEYVAYNVGIWRDHVPANWAWRR